MLFAFIISITEILTSFLLSTDLDPLVSSVLPGQFSTSGRPASCTPILQQQNAAEEMEMEVKEKGDDVKSGCTTIRKIRAPRGEGMSSLMASLTSSKQVNSCQVHSLPRLATNSSLSSEGSCNSISYRTLSASPSCCQVSLRKFIVENERKSVI